ncbi:MAG: Ppx/GppA family phosphatase [Defluviitaleaceae bacterium]|nr:Ppx/GppA family phosphatase [Defluviitaleaceae bacterium]
MDEARTVAVIDVGSNSIKYILGGLNTDGTLKTIADENDIARLGEGLRETGVISPEAMERNIAAISVFANKARDAGADEIRCVGTMALRNAGNTADFIRRVKDTADITLSVIPGEEEARLSYMAVLSGLGAVGDGGVAVFDTGGGSTEFVFGEGDEIKKRFSIDLGAIRITEKHFTSDPVTPESVENALAEIMDDLADGGLEGSPSKLVGIGGTVTSMGAVKHKMEKYDPDIIQGSKLTRADVEAQIADYSAKTLEERKAVTGLQPRRADVILAGACILKAILTRLNADELTVSDRGLRHGMAYELLSKPRARV